MQLARVLPLSTSSWLYKLAFLTQNCIENDELRAARPVCLSCWQLGWRILANMAFVGFLLSFAVFGLLLVGIFLYQPTGLRETFAVGLGLWLVPASFIWAWRRLRVGKRLHVLKRRICPVYMIQ